jgi:hypothetical protein
VVTADHTTSVTTPPLVVGQPTRMPPGWQGGWVGAGPFHGGGWPGS